MFLMGGKGLTEFFRMRSCGRRHSVYLDSQGIRDSLKRTHPDKAPTQVHIQKCHTQCRVLSVCVQCRRLLVRREKHIRKIALWKMTRYRRSKGRPTRRYFRHCPTFVGNFSIINVYC